MPRPNQTTKTIAETALNTLLEQAHKRGQEVEAELPEADSVSASGVRRLLRATRLRDEALLNLGRFVAQVSKSGLKMVFTEDVGVEGVEVSEYVFMDSTTASGWQDAAVIDLCVGEEPGDGEALSAAASLLSEVLPETKPRAPVTIPDGFLQPKIEGAEEETASTEWMLFDSIFKSYPKPEVYKNADQVMDEMREVMLWAPETWKRLSTEQVFHLLNVSVPLLRHVQQTVNQNFEMISWFQRLTAISRTMQPGFVYGLAQTHTSESWLEAATRAYEEMRAYAEDDGARSAKAQPKPQGKMKQALKIMDAVKTGDPDIVLMALAENADVPLHKYPSVIQGLRRYKDKLTGNPAYDRVMAADRKISKEEEDDDEDENVATSFYEHIALTRGRKAVIVGGSPRPQIEERIKSHLQLDELEWIEITPNSIRQVESKQESGTLDFVFLLQRFVSHKTYHALKRGPAKTGNLFVLVPNGYGLKSVCEALTNALRVSERIE